MGVERTLSTGKPPMHLHMDKAACPEAFAVDRKALQRPSRRPAKRRKRACVGISMPPG
jgi:hypothetical protein